MPEQLRITTDEAHLAAAVAVRRDVQAVASRAAESPHLQEAVNSARLALIALNATMIGTDPLVIYGRLIMALVSVERAALNVRVAHPEMELAT